VGGWGANGEFIRLINKQSLDEFIFGLLEPEVSSFCVGRSSPMYRGSKQSIALIKGYEDTKDFTTLTNYPLVAVGPTLSKEANTIVDEMGGTVSINNLKVYFGNIFQSYGGVDYDSDTDKRILINQNISYEITFRFQVSDVNLPVSFGCRCFTASGIELIPKTALNWTTYTRYFYKKIKVARANTWYWMRGIVYGVFANPVTSNRYTTAEMGYNLKLCSGTKYIVPIVIGDITGATGLSFPCTFRVYDLKVRPLETTQASCFLANKRLILSYVKNNGDYTDTEVEEITRNYLIPYDSAIQFEFLN
jgi:hypothetical protein